MDSGYEYLAAYENAVNTKLIDFNQVAGGTNGVYPVPKNRELLLTAEDVRKMLDDGVFTHINLPQGYFNNESDTVQNVTYQIKAGNDSLVYHQKHPSGNQRSVKSFY